MQTIRKYSQTSLHHTFTCVNKICWIANHWPIDSDAVTVMPSTGRTLWLMKATREPLHPNITGRSHSCRGAQKSLLITITIELMMCMNMTQTQSYSVHSMDEIPNPTFFLDNNKVIDSQIPSITVHFQHIWAFHFHNLRNFEVEAFVLTSREWFLSFYSFIELLFYKNVPATTITIHTANIMRYNGECILKCFALER